MHRAGPERHRQDLIVIGTAEEGREILVLLEVAVKQHQLLLAVGRVIDGVQVQGQSGSGPASLESWAAEVSTTRGKSLKKSKPPCQTGCKLMVASVGDSSLS